MSNSSSGAAPALQLPNSLNLPAHLSAQKYFFVCTLTVLAWDTLVLTPRSYKLARISGWPALKAMYYFLQIWVLADFVVTGVMFFSTTVDPDTTCRAFWPYEPICTAILLAVASGVHVIRITAIYNHHPRIRALMGGLFAVQVVVTAICCGFYRSVHLLSGQGCIAGPLNNAAWVGIYWLAPTLLYITSFVLAVQRSLASQVPSAASSLFSHNNSHPSSGTLVGQKKLTPWRLMLRDNLNLYGAILLVNLANVLFYFSITPTDNTDPIRTIVSSMAGVLTATMSMRIVLGVRGPLVGGGSFLASGTSASGSGSGSGSGGPHTHSLSQSRPGPNPPTFTLGAIGSKGVTVSVGGPKEWDADKSSVNEEPKGPVLGDEAGGGVQVTVERGEVYDEFPRGK
ncbi:hypothetical protein BJ138DRAFT_1114048 [Hygrophoropsis aurantiaca]|uniref:Uncharacterized protein n=1 Tax=Hygrophoropsis aurantiaca TaxID=72124 RepID=A0ACB8AAL7_9AGAM|nr:hypothetical protein BJ138DRAFT_1114048 [Hygrophoropsis aurantiaca]